uniref:Uncharacterized protein n=1 Tax=Ciona savignyi TaxID=51511 RepID=H2ZHV0_CIOSA
MKTQTLLAVLFMCLLVVDMGDALICYRRRRIFRRRRCIFRRRRFVRRRFGDMSNTQEEALDEDSIPMEDEQLDEDNEDNNSE